MYPAFLSTSAIVAKFLGKRYEGVSYTGVDIVPEFISEAKKKYPNYDFIDLDYFSEPLSQKYDIVLASGVMNSNISSTEADADKNLEWRKNNIKVMFEHTKRVLAFNMLGAHPQPNNDPLSNVWYSDLVEVLEYCLSLTRRVILRANYHPTDFTIFMYPTKSE